ncbi:hypothetical protein FRY77_05665 [Halomonas sp. MG34]|nr:hypothetical protein [Halomonas sp. MG34]
MNMKDLFPDYFVDEEKVKAIWDDCLFAFDANFLCDLYRYSDITRLDFIDVMNRFSDRVWLPNRAMEEYLRNRRVVISKQEALYVDVIKKLNILEENLNHKKQHPFVSKELHAGFFDVSRRLKEELENSKVEYVKRINGGDEIRNKIVDIFDEKVGFGFTDEELQEILKEGEVRYQNKTPPGYKDKEKEKDEHENKCLTENDKKCKPYGDLIVWKQIIAKAKKDKVNIVFVTSDSKEDWWKKEGNNTLGPRGELVEEFESETEMFFHMYSPDRFLKFAQERMKVKVNEEALEEIKEIKKEDEKKFLNKDRTKELLVSEIKNISLENYNFNESMYQGRLKQSMYEKDALYSEILKLHNERDKIKYMIMKTREENDDAEFMKMMKIYDDNQKAIEKVNSAIRNLEQEIRKLSYNLDNNSEQRF